MIFTLVGEIYFCDLYSSVHFIYYEIDLSTLERIFIYDLYSRALIQLDIVWE